MKDLSNKYQWLLLFASSVLLFLTNGEAGERAAKTLSFLSEIPLLLDRINDILPVGIGGFILEFC